MRTERRENIISNVTKTPDRPYREGDIRTAYQHDVDEIIYSESFRKLSGKQQLFAAVLGDDLRNRLTHSLEVARIAHHIAVHLDISEELTEAIALGHDLGHPPFGHAGERALDMVLKSFGHSDGFDHASQGYRVVKFYLKDITTETSSGIRHHSCHLPHFYFNLPEDLSPEGQLIRICDQISFINSDIEDGRKLGIITDTDLEELTNEKLSSTTGKKISELGPRYTDIIVGQEYHRIGSIEELIIEANTDPHQEKTRTLHIGSTLLEILALIKEKLDGKLYKDPRIRNKDLHSQNVVASVLRYLITNFESTNDEIIQNLREWITDREQTLTDAGLFDPIDREPPRNIIYRQAADYVCCRSDGETYDIFKAIYVPIA